MSERAALTVALWVMHCHALDAFSTSPRLVIGSTQPGSGKTTLLGLLSLLVPRPLDFCGGASRAVLWSLGYRPTLLIDDAPSLIESSRQIRAILHNGAQRMGARVLTPARNNAEAVDIFVPAVLAVGGQLPPSLAGRAIGIRLNPLPPGVTVTPITTESETDIEAVKRNLARWAADALPELRNVKQDYSIAPVWRPLIAIAAQSGPECEAQARAAMESVRTVLAPPTTEKLLDDIREQLDDLAAGYLLLRTSDGRRITDTDRIRSADLVGLLVNHDEETWGRWGRANMPITPTTLGHLLGPTGIKSGMLHFRTVYRDGTPGGAIDHRGYLIRQFTEAFSKLPPNRVSEAA